MLYSVSFKELRIFLKFQFVFRAWSSSYDDITIRTFLITFILFWQVENYITRPLSCEGPSDSGVSVSSEYIATDGDSSSLATQSQTVSWLTMKFYTQLSIKTNGMFSEPRNCFECCANEEKFLVPVQSLMWNFFILIMQDIESHRLKRGHVLAELLETERIYVNEMKSILTVNIFPFLRA